MFGYADVSAIGKILFNGASENVSDKGLNIFNHPSLLGGVKDSRKASNEVLNFFNLCDKIATKRLNSDIMTIVDAPKIKAKCSGLGI